MTVKSNKFAAANTREFYLQIYWNSGANFWEKLLQKNKKAYEGFFTNEKQTDMSQFESLGVVTNRTARPFKKIQDLFNKL